MTEPTEQKKGRGGKRAGAGRPRKPKVAPSGLSDLDVQAALAQPAPDDIEAVAALYARGALDALIAIVIAGKSEPARIAAATEVLDRAYGKPAVDIGGEPQLPFMSAPATASVSAEIRAEARRHARLAIDALRRIADSGVSETSRASASRALLARGLGTVGTAKPPDEFGNRPITKRDEQT